MTKIDLVKGSLDEILSNSWKLTYANKCTICNVAEVDGSLPYCSKCYSENVMKKSCPICLSLCNNEGKCNWCDMVVELNPLKIKKSDNIACTSTDDDGYAKEHAYEKAEKLGLKVVEPDNNILLIDLDTPEQETEFYKRLLMLKQLKDGQDQLILDTLETKSSGGNKHVYIRINKALKPMTRIGLQALLGSDPMREVLSLRRVLNDGPINTVLFETEEEYNKVKAWLNPVCSKVEATKQAPIPPKHIWQYSKDWMMGSDLAKIEKELDSLTKKVKSIPISLDVENIPDFSKMDWLTIPIDMWIDKQVS